MDEISIVSITIYNRLGTILRQITGIDKSIGGVSVLAVGDLNQLPPVGDLPVYRMPSSNENIVFVKINP